MNYADEARDLLRNRPGFAREIARQLARQGGDGTPRVGGLTKRQRDLLLFIRSYVGKNGIVPSFDEMKEALGLASKSGIHRLISALEERGFIRRIPGRARAITLVAA